MQIIMRYLWLVLIAADLVGLAVIFACNAPRGGTDGPHQAASQSMRNPFVLADLDGATLTPHAARITIELRFAHCLESCPTVFITWGDRLNQAQNRV
jgi:hypothetical protein